MNVDLKEYIVTLKNHSDLNQFYIDMETENNVLLHIPYRSVECIFKRPTSRNTHYLLYDSEAKMLNLDSRVEYVTRISDIKFEKNNFSKQTAVWDRGLDISQEQKNWGLLRLQLEQNLPEWGSGSASDFVTQPINFTATGKNVDIVIVDEIVYPDHPDFTGRVIEYDWFRQHDLAVKGAATTISSVERNTNISTITTSAPHRIVDNAVVDIECTSDSSFNETETMVNVISPTQFQYSNVGADSVSAPATGFWRGVYQYDNYAGSNNHATAIAGVIAGATNGWARDSNIYNLRHDAFGFNSGEYTPPDLLIDYIRQFHATKPINPDTGKRNPTLVNNSWGLIRNFSFSQNPYTGNPNYSRLNYQGSYVTPITPAVDTGISGVFSSTLSLASFASMSEGLAYRILTDAVPSANISAITYEESQGIGLVDAGANTGSGSNGIDSNDDAIWQLSLPFDIEYTGVLYNNITVSSNSFIAPGTPFLGNLNNLIEFAENYPTTNKIFISAGDRNVQSIKTGTFGTSPNRTHILRFEGWDGAYGSINSQEPDNNLIWEVVFYESAPSQIDLRIVKNAAFRPEFNYEDLNSYGAKLEGLPVPIRLPSLDADIVDAINEGIIFVGAAGNSSYKIDTEFGDDYNNYFIENGETIYYHRGSSPANSHNSLISVGTLDSSVLEPKSASSNTGPGVDLYAPGINIVSSSFDTSGNASPVVTDLHLDISGGGGVIGQTDRITIVTSQPHNLSNSDIVTIDNCSKSVYNIEKSAITVINSTDFTYNIRQVIFSENANIDSVSGNGPWTVVISGISTTSNIEVSVLITATDNGGSLGTGGNYLITDITGTTITVTAENGTEPLVGAIRNLTIVGYQSEIEPLTGTVKVGQLYQKWSGSSIAAAQVTGILAMALESYPTMTQAEAKSYVLAYAKTGIMQDSGGSYSDDQSLQGGVNRVAYLHKERPDRGALIPKRAQWLRPTSGMVFPRPLLRRK